MKKILLLMVLTLLSCESSNKVNHEIAGLWRGVLTSPGGELPFGIEITNTKEGYIAKIINGLEKVDTSSIEFINNSITINFAWYDAKIKAELINSNTMSGHWSKTASGENKTSSLPFKASRGFNYRFNAETNHAATTSITGNWEAIFKDDEGEDKAIAEFMQDGQIVTGTFLTPTGDYRYLAGVANNNKLYLSAFDGAHAFLFNAEIHNNTISNGNFWSRDSYHANWTAKKSENTTRYLPSSWEMNKTINQVHFAFEDTNGKLVQLTDKRFNNKPVLINLFGTWCPNCNDEAPVLANFYNEYNQQGLEIVGLAFEFTEDPFRDNKQLKIFKKRHGIKYPLLLAGGNDKAQATKILGFLDKVKSYPTTIYLDRSHQVVKVHTGFSGPGTGEHYLKLVNELESEIVNLLK